MRPLTATSYAVLGLLAVAPRSAYDLVQQMKSSNLRFFWPRTESKLYEEPRNLVAHKLAAASTVRAGKRSRSVYTITPVGRRALARWLDEPGAGPLIEFESMLKIVYADFGSHDQLLVNIRRIAEGTAERAAIGVPLARNLADSGPRFPERAHVIAVADRFLVEIMDATLRWAAWAEQIVARWPSAKQNGAMATEAQRLLAENAVAVEAIAGGHRVGGAVAKTPRRPRR